MKESGLNKLLSTPRGWQRLLGLSVLIMFLSHLSLTLNRLQGQGGGYDWFLVITGSLILTFLAAWSGFNGERDFKFLGRCAGMTISSLELHRLGYSWCLPELLNETGDASTQFKFISVSLLIILFAQSLSGKKAADLLKIAVEKFWNSGGWKLPRFKKQKALTTEIQDQP